MPRINRPRALPPPLFPLSLFSPLPGTMEVGVPTALEYASELDVMNYSLKQPEGVSGDWVPPSLWGHIADFFYADVVVVDGLADGIGDTIMERDRHFIDCDGAKDEVRQWLLTAGTREQPVCCGCCGDVMQAGAMEVKFACEHWAHQRCWQEARLMDDGACPTCGGPAGVRISRVPDSAEGGRDPGGGARRKRALVVSTKASATQALIAKCAGTGAEALLILVAFARHQDGEAMDQVTIPTMAARQWGTRVVQLCEELAVAGKPAYLNVGGSPVHGSLIMATVPLRALRVRTQATPHTLVWRAPRAPEAVRILVNKGFLDAWNNVLKALEEGVTEKGCQTHWVASPIRTRRTSASYDEAAPEAISFTLYIHGSETDSAREFVEGTLRGITTYDEGSPVSFLMEHEFNQAVLIPMAASHVAEAITAVRTVTSLHNVRFWATNAGIFAFHINERAITAFLSCTAMQRFLGPVCEPLRFSISTGPSERTSWWKGTKPDLGQTRQFLLNLPGSANMDEVRIELGRALRGSASVTAVEAWHPCVQTYVRMLLVKAGENNEDTIRRLIDGSVPLAFHGARAEVLAFSHTRTHKHLSSATNTKPDDLQKSFQELSLRLRNKGSTYTLVGTFYDCDAAGEVIPGPARNSLLRVNKEALAPARKEAHHCVGFALAPLRTQVNLWRKRPPQPQAEEGTAQDWPEITLNPAEWAAACGYDSLRLQEEQPNAEEWTLLPGEALVTPIRAGGLLKVIAAGESVSVIATSYLVAHIKHPSLAVIGQLGEGVPTSVCVRVQRGAGHALHFRHQFRVPPASAVGQPTNEQASAPIEVDTDDADVWAWATRRLTSQATVPQPAAEVCPAAREAASAYAAQVFPLGEGQQARLAQWIQERIARMSGDKSRNFWQWDISIIAWVLHQAGIKDLAAHDRGRLSNYLVQAGLPVYITREPPFKAWQSGNGSYPAACMVPGMRCNPSAGTARRTRGRTARPITQGVEEALERAVAAHSNREAGSRLRSQRAVPAPRKGEEDEDVPMGGSGAAPAAGRAQGHSALSADSQRTHNSSGLIAASPDRNCEPAVSSRTGTPDVGTDRLHEPNNEAAVRCPPCGLSWSNTQTVNGGLCPRCGRNVEDVPGACAVSSTAPFSAATAPSTPRGPTGLGSAGQDNPCEASPPPGQPDPSTPGPPETSPSRRRDTDGEQECPPEGTGPTLPPATFAGEPTERKGPLIRLTFKQFNDHHCHALLSSDLATRVKAQGASLPAQPVAKLVLASGLSSGEEEAIRATPHDWHVIIRMEEEPAARKSVHDGFSRSMKTSLKAKGPVMAAVRRSRPPKKATSGRPKGPAIDPDPVDGQLNSPERTPGTPREPAATGAQPCGATDPTNAPVAPGRGEGSGPDLDHPIEVPAGDPQIANTGLEAPPPADTDGLGTIAEEQQPRSQTVPAAALRPQAEVPGRRRAASLGARAHGDSSRDGVIARTGRGASGGDRDWPPRPPQNLGILRPERQGLISFPL